MNQEVIKSSTLLFQEDVYLTEVTEYGFSWQDFAQQKKTIPPEGLKFDIYFEGKITGDIVQGTIKGVDYLTVRADGRLFLNLHATITTKEGVQINVTESGINHQGKLRLSMDFHTNNSQYAWMNHKHVWGIGTVDFATGAVKIQGYLN